MIRFATRAIALVCATAMASCSADADDARSADAPTPKPTAVAATAPLPSTTAPSPPDTTGPAATTTSPTTTEPPPLRDFSAVGPVVEAFVAERGLNGAGLVVVDADDGVVHEQYWGEFSADRITLVASSSKMVVAGVLLALQDDGLLDLDAPIATYVDWAAAHPDITVAQLLSNSSGLVGLLPNPVYEPYLCQFLPVGDLQDCAAAILASPDDDADLAPPDTEFRYGGSQWQVAGAVAEAVSGRPWSQLIEEIYVRPCGLEATGFSNHFIQFAPLFFTYPAGYDADPTLLPATDNPNMEGGMYTTPTDYARLLLMHLRDGECDGGRVLSPDALELAHADRIGAVYGGESMPGSGYGLGWWVDRSTGRLTDPGAYGTVPWLDLTDGYGAYLVIEADSPTGNELASRLYDPVDAAMQEP